MDTEQRELFRLALLRIFDANQTRYGLGLAALGHLGRSYGFFNSGAPQLERELRYLQDKGYIGQLFKTISPENRVWRITAAGRDFLAELTNE